MFGDVCVYDDGNIGDGNDDDDDDTLWQSTFLVATSHNLLQTSIAAAFGGNIRYIKIRIYAFSTHRKKEKKNFLFLLSFFSVDRFYFDISNMHIHKLSTLERIEVTHSLVKSLLLLFVGIITNSFDVVAVFFIVNSISFGNVA